MGWTDHVVCGKCGASDWVVQFDGWTCYDCGKTMTETEVAAYHATLDV
jgi:hypothetical protein